MNVALDVNKTSAYLVSILSSVENETSADDKNVSHLCLSSSKSARRGSNHVWRGVLILHSLSFVFEVSISKRGNLVIGSLFVVGNVDLASACSVFMCSLCHLCSPL